jgi:ribosomal protein S27E
MLMIINQNVIFRHSATVVIIIANIATVVELDGGKSLFRSNDLVNQLMTNTD